MKFWSEKKKLIIALIIFVGFIIGAYIPYAYTEWYTHLAACAKHSAAWAHRTVIEPICRIFKK